MPQVVLHFSYAKMQETIYLLPSSTFVEYIASICLECLQLNCAKSLRILQVAQLSQRNRAAGWVSFGPNITGTRYCAPNVVGLGQEAQVTAENARI